MEEKEGITLNELFQALLKRWYIIFITVILGVLTTGVLAFVVVIPKYKSTAEIMVQPQTGNGFDLNDANKISETVAYHFQTDLVLEHVVETLDSPNITVASIRNDLEVTYKTTMFYMKISYTHTNKSISKIIAQQVVDSGEHMANNGRVPMLQDSFIKISFAKEGVYVSPNKTLYLIVGFLIGALIGAVIVFLIEFARYTFKDKESIEAELKLQVVGLIPEYVDFDKLLLKRGKKEKSEIWKNYLDAKKKKIMNF